jgi:hypothetical protein
MLKGPLSRLAPIALLALVLPGCEKAQTPEQLTGAPALSHNWNSGELVQTESPTATSSVSAVIGPAGGVLRNGENELRIPPMAVSEDTEFRFTMVGGTYIIADLGAIRMSDGSMVTSFAHPVRLRLSYRGAFSGDPHRLRITYLVDGTVQGRRQAQASAVSPASKTVSAWLTHFSIYSMEIN